MFCFDKIFGTSATIVVTSTIFSFQRKLLFALEQHQFLCHQMHSTLISLNCSSLHTSFWRMQLWWKSFLNDEKINVSDEIVRPWQLLCQLPVPGGP